MVEPAGDDDDDDDRGARRGWALLTLGEVWWGPATSNSCDDAVDVAQRWRTQLHHG